MLPRLRLIVATFVGGFLLAAAAVHFVGSARTTQQARLLPPAERAGVLPAFSTIDWRRQDPQAPALFEVRFSADLTAMTATPPQNNAPVATPPEAPAADLPYGMPPEPQASAPALSPAPAPEPAAETGDRP